MVKTTGKKRSLDAESDDKHNERQDERESKRSNRGGEPLLKLLVPNYAAGALIGKGGSLIAELQETFGGRMHLSGNTDFYPGTEERIIVLTGQISEIIDLNEHIIEKVVGDPNKDIDGRGQKVKIVLTNAAAGLLIGKGGLTIKSIQEESSTKISISGLDVAAVSGERVLTMSGNKSERKEGCRLVIEKIAEDSGNMANTAVKYHPSSAITSVGNSGFSSMLQNENLFSALSSDASRLTRGISNIGNLVSHKKQLKTKVEVQMEIPDALVGAMLGKQGTSIRDLAIKSGAKFRFSEKNDFAEGTTDRILTITGEMNQTYVAYHLVHDKVEQLEASIR